MVEKRATGPTVLAWLMSDRAISADWLVARSRELFPDFPLSKSTINNWRRGTSTVAQDWRSVATIAQVLDLDRPEADDLMASLGCLTVSHRQRTAISPADLRFLVRWAGSERDAATPVGPDGEGAAEPMEPSASSARSAAEESCRVILAEAVAAESDGNREIASTLYDRALDLARQCGAFELAARAALGGGGFSGRVGGQPDRLRRLQVLQAEAPDPVEPGSDWVAETTVELAYELWVSQLPWDERLERILLTISERPDRMGLQARRMLLNLRDHDRRAHLDEAEALVSEAKQVGRPDDRIKCLVTASHIAACEGAWALSTAWTNLLEDLGRQHREPRAQWQAATYHAALLDARGLSDEADTEAARARELGRRFEFSDAEATFAMVGLGRILRRDELGSVREAIEAAASRYRYPVWHAIRGLAALGAGDRDAAARDLRHAADRHAHAVDPFRVPSMALTATLACQLGDTEAAASAAGELKEWSGRFAFLGSGGPLLGPVDWFLAQEAGLRRDQSARDGLVDQATFQARQAGAKAWLRSDVRQRWIETIPAPPR